MKTYFIEARSDAEVKLSREMIAKLPKKIALFTTIQYYYNILKVKAELEKSGRKVILLKTKRTKPGQLLGCSIEKFKGDFEAFFYIGDGLFHPKALMFYNNKPVFVLNPLSNKFLRLEEKEVDGIRKRTKGAMLKFLAGKYAGFLISTKPGQKNIQATILDLERFEKNYPDKEFYYFITDEIRNEQLESFPFIEVFINCACPRLALDDSLRFEKPIINFTAFQRR